MIKHTIITLGKINLMNNKIHNLNPFDGQIVNTSTSTSGYLNSIYGPQGITAVPYTSPYSGPYTGISTQPISYNTQQDVTLRKVENGWVLKMHNKEYVLTDTEQVTKYLKLFEENQVVK